MSDGWCRKEYNSAKFPQITHPSEERACCGWSPIYLVTMDYGWEHKGDNYECRQKLEIVQRLIYGELISISLFSDLNISSG